MAHPLAETVGVKTQRARRRLGLSQEYVAQSIGVSLEWYQRLESGCMLPDVGPFLNLCELLKVPADELLVATSRPQLKVLRGGAEPELREPFRTRR